MIVRELGEDARREVDEKLLVLEKLEVQDKSVSVKLVNSKTGKVMKLRVFDGDSSNNNFGGDVIFLKNVTILSARTVYYTREYVCSSIVLANAEGETMIIAPKGSVS